MTQPWCRYSYKLFWVTEEQHGTRWNWPRWCKRSSKFVWCVGVLCWIYANIWYADTLQQILTDCWYWQHAHTFPTYLQKTWHLCCDGNNIIMESVSWWLAGRWKCVVWFQMYKFTKQNQKTTMSNLHNYSVISSACHCGRNVGLGSMFHLKKKKRLPTLQFAEFICRFVSWTQQHCGRQSLRLNLKVCVVQWEEMKSFKTVVNHSRVSLSRTFFQCLHQVKQLSGRGKGRAK